MHYENRSTGGQFPSPAQGADYYELFGVDKNAPREAIRAAYRKLAKIYHPDMETSDEETLKALAGAYEVLSTPRKRAQYNAYLSRLAARRTLDLRSYAENLAPGVHVIIA